jgi:integrase
MEGFELPRRDDAVIEPPTVEEVQQILKFAAPHLYRAILLSYYTGLRAGEVELLGLRWQDVNLNSGHIVIRSADKGGHKKRTVPIMEDAFLKLLESWLQEDEEQKKKMSEPIVTYQGKPIKSLKSAWSAAKRRAKITRRLRMYDLRHSFATKLLDNGADLKHVSCLLGHKSVQQTVDTYQHTSRRLSEEAVQKLPSVLSSSNTGNNSNTFEKT